MTFEDVSKKFSRLQEKVKATFGQKKTGYFAKKIFYIIKWTPVIGVGVGFSLWVLQQYNSVIVLMRKADPDNTVRPELPKGWKVSLYRKVPLRTLSRTWGLINNVYLPVWARKPVLSWYVDKFDCNVAEAEIDDLEGYSNLGEFFRRALKPGVRPIGDTPVVSPVDGIILHRGMIRSETHVEQVKGVSYPIGKFLGPQTWIKNPLADKHNYGERLMKKRNTALYHCVIYLGPGDYHRFHSPVDWKVTFRRHFAGDLLSVSPKMVGWIKGLFTLNERVVYVGEWEHGFYSYTAVGATNVGSIKVYADKGLVTNSRKMKKGMFEDKAFEEPISFKKGDAFGEFNLGSTIVLLFEAPVDYEFVADVGTRIFMGETLFKPKESNFR